MNLREIVDAAIDNEATTEGVTREDCLSGVPERNAWNNAQVYADMYHVKAEDFRATMRAMGWEF